ncbi:enoyl-CoA hydratase/isomerase family protein [Mycobacterium sp. AT1]|uniref:enoyl-CoA hydratase/isomerase family protein n=1 Tax=Mycobacterium sp. AT1 TaxID=1961706 RepID=UPI0009C97CBD|nr:enoyl-CoA hydratase/isomerase family protein [Mycobacterium sp. AT1]OPX11933.1 hypothetical protein B1790_05620 [Mycobacterium sp. AT1]
MTELKIDECRDGVVDVVIDRAPDNLMSVEMCAQLTALATDPPADAHILRLRAIGGMFCGGRDRAGTDPADLVAETRVLAGLHRALRESRLVSIAEVHADAAGFGVGLIAACDVSVAVRDAAFWFPEVGINLAPALVLAWLPRMVGDRDAFWLTATGERISADRAERLGLINEVVADANALTETVTRRITALRTRNPRIHAEIKSMIRTFNALDENQALETSIHRLTVGALRRHEGTSAAGTPS